MSFILKDLVAAFTGSAAESTLKIVNVDYCLAENGKEHRTSRFELMNRGDAQAHLVVRRGQPFVLNLTLSRHYDPSVDDIAIIFTLDDVEKSQYGPGTLIFTEVLQPRKASNGAWRTEIDGTHGDKSLRIKVTPAANAFIGKWRIKIDTKLRDRKGAHRFTVDHPFYMLFNPWCKEDVVYLDNESERQEYVLSDTGLIWVGSVKQCSPLHWTYSQFDCDILDCAIYTMNKVGKVRSIERNDPVTITRRLSAAINSNDDNGVLVGNWTDDYTGGKAPTKWLGSREILQQYYRSKNPQKYGQCWVFAGVLTSVCRALGLPCRVVTNFLSAHDSEGSLTIDHFFDENGQVVKKTKMHSSDSIWNFHVWGEAWMKRLDLTADCDGWQVLDATPQELSENLYQCGPASVAAINRGDLQKPYDNSFVYAEVNADELWWQYNESSQGLRLLERNIRRIGQNITTKAVGKMEPEDITHTYKHPETSKEERTAVLKALCQGESDITRWYLDEFKQEEFKDLVFNFEMRDDIIIGQPFSVVLMIKNLSNEKSHRVTAMLRVETVTYTGRTIETVKQSKNEHCIGPDSAIEVRLEVSWEDYGPKLLDHCAFKILCHAPVKGTDFTYINQDDFCVQKPSIVIELKNKSVVAKALEATARFTNPLPISLKKGKFYIGGAGKQQKIKLQEDVEVGGEAICSFWVTPRIVGRETIAAKFYSQELKDVNGFHDFTVK